MVDEEGLIKFVIVDRIKSTRKVLRPHIITCFDTEMEELNVLNYVKFYIDATKDTRGVNDRKLFISWKTHHNVSKCTLARWLKEVLKLSNIDT